MNSPTMTRNTRFPQVRISLRESLVLENKRAARCVNTDTALTRNTCSEVPMATIPDNAQSLFAQDTPTDPLIEQARLVHWAAQLERNLAARKALRPARSEAARKGWEARRG